LRVSTRMQGRSGVGLTAQRDDIERFALQQGLRVESWYQDIQMGGSADALTLRPGLARVLKEAKAARCPMIVSKLDRLSRNVHFISGLMAAAAVLKRAGKKLGVLRWTKRKRLGSRAVKRQKYHLAYRGQMIWNTNCQHGESGARSPACPHFTETVASSGQGIVGEATGYNRTNVAEHARSQESSGVGSGDGTFDGMPHGFEVYVQSGRNATSDRRGSA